MKMRYRRKAGDEQKRIVAEFRAKLARINEQSAVVRALTLLNSLYPSPDPMPGEWWFDFNENAYKVFDPDSGGWRLAGADFPIELDIGHD